MDLLIGDQVQVSIMTDYGLTLVTGTVTLVGNYKPDILKFELAGLSSVFYTDDENMTVKKVS